VLIRPSREGLQTMRDLPCIVMAATVWAYWVCVGAMIVRVRRRTRKLSGIVPSQRLEQFMWIVWVPLVAAWMLLPYVAAGSTLAPWQLPPWARELPYGALRWLAVAVGLGCLGLSIHCWRRMGRNWRMAVAPDQQTELVTTGLYRLVRHPIYALSILLMVCTWLVVPTLPVALMAVVHISLMLAKARNEESFMVGRHGAAYRSYMQRTGRFVPRLRAWAGARDDA
jgi:protein-S-isoprenylcysteine O-methyltransferase Ste14